MLCRSTQTAFSPTPSLSHSFEHCSSHSPTSRPVRRRHRQHFQLVYCVLFLNIVPRRSDFHLREATEPPHPPVTWKNFAVLLRSSTTRTHTFHSLEHFGLSVWFMGELIYAVEIDLKCLTLSPLSSASSSVVGGSRSQLWFLLSTVLKSLENKAWKRAPLPFEMVMQWNKNKVAPSSV